MKSVLFIMNYNINNLSRRKYDDQMNAVKRLGYDVWCIGNDGENIYLCHNGENTMIGKIKKSPVASVWENFVYRSLYSSVKQALKIKSDFTFCYMRRFFFEGKLCMAAKMLKKHGVKNIMEIPTYPPKNEMGASNSFKHKLVWAINDHYEAKSAKYFDLFCPMGEHTETYANRPALNIVNGLDVSNIKLRTPVYKDGEYHIICLAIMAYWHGYDRIIKSLADYKKAGGDAKIYIHMVGEGAALPTWKKLASDLNVSEYVLFEGKKDNNALNAEFDKYDLGVASLGRFRSGLSVVYELKTREYMARGLPFIYATDDYVIHNFGKYCIRVPNDETPIDMNALLDFMKEMRQNMDARFEMRKYAETEMTFDKQFSAIFDYFEK